MWLRRRVAAHQATESAPERFVPKSGHANLPVAAHIPPEHDRPETESLLCADGILPPPSNRNAYLEEALHFDAPVRETRTRETPDVTDFGMPSHETTNIDLHGPIVEEGSDTT